MSFARSWRKLLEPLDIPVILTGAAVPTLAQCPSGHRFSTRREAAAAIAQFGNNMRCPHRGCLQPFTYSIEHTYPGKGQSSYKAEHIIRLYNDDEAERHGYDPMLFVLKGVNTGTNSSGRSTGQKIETGNGI
jgi:hypothetical protein